MADLEAHRRQAHSYLGYISTLDLTGDVERQLIAILGWSALCHCVELWSHTVAHDDLPLRQDYETLPDFYFRVLRRMVSARAYRAARRAWRWRDSSLRACLVPSNKLATQIRHELQALTQEIFAQSAGIGVPSASLIQPTGHDTTK